MPRDFSVAHLTAALTLPIIIIIINLWTIIYKKSKLIGRRPLIMSISNFLPVIV